MGEKSMNIKFTQFTPDFLYYGERVDDDDYYVSFSCRYSYGFYTTTVAIEDLSVYPTVVVYSEVMPKKNYPQETVSNIESICDFVKENTKDVNSNL